MSSFKLDPHSKLSQFLNGKIFGVFHKNIGIRIDSGIFLFFKKIYSFYLLFLPIKYNQILLKTKNGKYEGYIKAICEYIIHNKLKYELIVIINTTQQGNAKKFPISVRVMIGGSFNSMKALYTSRVILDDTPRKKYPIHKKGQFYIQIWRDPLFFTEINTLSRDWLKKIDFCITGSERESCLILEQTGFAGTILKYGNIRNDVLTRANSLPDKERLIHTLGLDATENFKICLVIGSDGFTILSLSTLKVALESKFGGKWKFFVFGKMVQYAEGNESVVVCPTNISIRRWASIADIIIMWKNKLVADLLLSSAFIFVLQQKEDILDELSDFIRSSPCVAVPEVDLLNAIKNFNEHEYIVSRELFLVENGYVNKSEALKRVIALLAMVNNRKCSHEEIYMRLGGHKTLRAQANCASMFPFRIFKIIINGRWMDGFYKLIGKRVDFFAKKISKKIYKIIFRWIKIHNNKIVFRMFQHKYGCNPKYITEELLRRKKGYDIVWIVSLKDLKSWEDFPENIRIVDNDTIQSWYELYTAKVWVDNNVRRENPFKKNSQFFIQTWHGSLGIKRFDNVWDEEIRELTNKMTDMCVSNSTFETHIYRETYWKDSIIKEYGHPRNDIFWYNKEILKYLKTKICKLYGITEETKILLYAPTFRESHIGKKMFSSNLLRCYNINYQELKYALSERFGGKWIIVRRFHYHLRNALKNIKIPPEVVDVSDYNDIQELMAISDAMITDYSSCIYDFVLTKKPGFLFAWDLEAYTKERALYYDLKSTPFPVACSNRELLENVRAFDINQYKERVEFFLRDKGVCEDGQASKRVVDDIERMMEGTWER